MFKQILKIYFSWISISGLDIICKTDVIRKKVAIETKKDMIGCFLPKKK